MHTPMDSYGIGTHPPCSIYGRCLMTAVSSLLYLLIGAARAADMARRAVYRITLALPLTS